MINAHIQGVVKFDLQEKHFARDNTLDYFSKEMRKNMRDYFLDVFSAPPVYPPANCPCMGCKTKTYCFSPKAIRGYSHD